MQRIRKIAEKVKQESGNAMTDHARMRMASRGLSQKAIDMALAYGRTIYTKGAEIHALGRREVEKYRRQSLDLSSFEGIQVICAPDDGAVVTVYRNHDLSLIRRNKRSHHRHHKYA